MTLAIAEPFKAPTVASLSVRVVVDSFFDQFMPKATHPHVAIEHVSRIPGRDMTTLAGEWGLSLHLELKGAGAGGQYLLDFGYTPEILLRNFDLLDIRPERLDGLILSHAHRDHYGGMVGFVEQHRSRMRDDLKLFAGGDLVFREKWRGSRDEEPASWGALDRAALDSGAGRDGVLRDRARAPRPVHLGPRSPGNPSSASCPTRWSSRPRPITTAPRSGAAGSSPTAIPTSTPPAMSCRGAGSSSFPPAGIAASSTRSATAMAVSGVAKLHAVIGGFHLGVAPPDYVEHTIAELKALEPDVVLPMHCSGRAFLAGMAREMPDRLVLSNTGSRFTFGV